MKSLSFLYIPLVLVLFLFGCAAQPEAPSATITRLDGSTVDAASLTRQVSGLVEKAQVHGLSLAIFNQNRLVYKTTFGYSRLDTRSPLTDSTNFYGASLSKAVFGVLVMQLVEEGVLDLDVPLQDYLPKRIWEYEPQARWHDDFSDLAEDSLYHKITARMCLSHTAGFPNWRWFEADKKLKVLDTPGTRYRYSGEGMTYLQVVLEKMLGRGLEELAQEKIFQPLGMHNSSYQWQPRFVENFAWGHTATGALYEKDTDNEPRGASTLETTLTDYSRFLEAVLQQKLLSPAAYQELFTPQIRIRSLRQFGPLALRDSSLNDGISLSYGLGWGLLQSPHGVGAFKEGGGNGFKHYSILYPDAGIGVLIMTNSDNGEGLFKELLALTIADVYSPTDWNNYVPYQQKAAIPDSLYGYQCRPCGRACDRLTFAAYGTCPDCAMQLVPKILLVEGE
ncbi:serine hydrolase domain-containing protein [Cesiribacter andamanensis]|uniref:Penicillin-binding protein E n=1 Tax=Cesiribacter andamanensis AMV16 TaxID=1279009 RepID=M7NRE1_9BACT|nr:serine hydrolase domain-containing protein [Cesiribacter andamanensis]EMR01084.1 Penicillin-binding protein E [Cesiribacter andamanensis AMV16]